VPGHENKCRHPHGHNYVVFLTAEGELDEVGRVIDFSQLKARFGGWIETYWDHGTIVQRSDTEMLAALDHLGFGPKTYIMDNPPTAENMAQLIVDQAPRLLLGTGVRLTKVVLWETENCFVEVTC
jgi:6-pyruvoyltetrahydropterin/6-carboxytetrahydropterin synthase